MDYENKDGALDTAISVAAQAQKDEEDYRENGARVKYCLQQNVCPNCARKNIDRVPRKLFGLFITNDSADYSCECGLKVRLKEDMSFMYNINLSHNGKEECYRVSKFYNPDLRRSRSSKPRISQPKNTR